MDLGIQNKTFLLCGATEGLGNGIAKALLNDGANIIVVSRDQGKLDRYKQVAPEKIETIALDLTYEDNIHLLYKKTKDSAIDGLLVNAGGPPPKKVLETTLEDWDDAYRNILRWKVQLVKLFSQHFIQKKYGRMVFIESSTVKQPMENMVLSNALRLAVVGFVKTLSQEIASEGVTLNILAPGFHQTNAVDRVFRKKSEAENISYEEARNRIIANIKTGRIGDPEQFGLLGAWLLSPHSAYITGQTISVDGGFIQGVFG